MGDTYDRLSKLIAVEDDGTFRLALEYFQHYNFWDRRLYSDVFVEEFGPPRRSEEPISERHEALAAAMQRVFEETVTKLLTTLHTRSGLDSVVLSGGSFMNSVFNGMASRVTPFSSCFISGTPDDSGTSVGAALFLHALRTGSRPALSSHNYWGPEYSDDECLEIARRYKLPGMEVVDDPSRRAAEELAEGRIVGWFQGRMEFGQRALGNRSILLDPRLSDGRDVVNRAVKFREAFRPFAPAVHIDDRDRLFVTRGFDPDLYMLATAQVRPEARATLSGIVHEDDSARIQTVTPELNPAFAELLAGVRERTGTGCVVNTSFNVKGQPLIMDPETAIDTFSRIALDRLYIEGFVVEPTTIIDPPAPVPGSAG